MKNSYKTQNIIIFAFITLETAYYEKRKAASHYGVHYCPFLYRADHLRIEQY